MGNQPSNTKGEEESLIESVSFRSTPIEADQYFSSTINTNIISHISLEDSVLDSYGHAIISYFSNNKGSLIIDNILGESTSREIKYDAFDPKVFVKTSKLNKNTSEKNILVLTNGPSISEDTFSLQVPLSSYFDENEEEFITTTNMMTEFMLTISQISILVLEDLSYNAKCTCQAFTRQKIVGYDKKKIVLLLATINDTNHSDIEERFKRAFNLEKKNEFMIYIDSEGVFYSIYPKMESQSSKIEALKSLFSQFIHGSLIDEKPSKSLREEFINFKKNSFQSKQSIPRSFLNGRFVPYSMSSDENGDNLYLKFDFAISVEEDTEKNPTYFIKVQENAQINSFRIAIFGKRIFFNNNCDEDIISQKEENFQILTPWLSQTKYKRPKSHRFLNTTEIHFSQQEQKEISVDLL